jgi:hypothetical protein
MFQDRTIAEITPSDIQALIGVPEGQTLELKSDLPAEKPTERPDAWMRLQKAGRDRSGPEAYAKEGIFKELVAFANAEGGWLVIGVEESDEQPKRGASVKPLPDCHELASRLQYAASDWLDPPVPGVRFRGIEFGGGAGEGVVICRAPRSMLAPHRLSNKRVKEAYKRIGDQSKPMAMREIQEMTLQRASELRRLDDLIEQAFSSTTQVPSPGHDSVEFQIVAAPISAPLALEPLYRQPQMFERLEEVCLFLPIGERPIFSIDATWPKDAIQERFVPVLRGARRLWTCHSLGGTYKGTIIVAVEIKENGLLSLIVKRDHGSNLEADWVIAEIANAFRIIERIRRACGSPDAEFALDLIIRPSDRGTQLAPIGDGVGHRYDMPRFPAKMPRYSIGRIETFHEVMEQAARDLNNFAGSARDDLVFAPFISTL